MSGGQTPRIHPLDVAEELEREARNTDHCRSARDLMSVAAEEIRLLRQANKGAAEVHATLERYRETNRRLNLRCQEAEGIIAKAGLVEGREQGPKGRTLGRALANYAALLYREDRDRARFLAAGWRRLARLYEDTYCEHPPNCRHKRGGDRPCARCGYSRAAHENDDGYYNQCEAFE